MKSRVDIVEESEVIRGIKAYSSQYYSCCFNANQRFGSIKSLDLYNCKRIKAIPVLDALPSLEKLSLMATSITNVSLINLKGTSELEEA